MLHLGVWREAVRPAKPSEVWERGTPPEPRPFGCPPKADAQDRHGLYPSARPATATVVLGEVLRIGARGLRGKWRGVAGPAGPAGPVTFSYGISCAQPFLIGPSDGLGLRPLGLRGTSLASRAS